MSVPALLAFAGLCLLLAITPGPDTFLVLRHSLSGARLGIAAAAGSGLGSFAWLLVVAVVAARAGRWLRRPKVARALGNLSSRALAVLGVATLSARTTS
ncbi:hypothetical protein ACFWUP_24040 [Nocardia sp. NPDC058658]|uniref:hypothetical protein n=1 Tax=Nocardia sp. NPDC058658 TaxID=3346580 RepID=UPI0036653A74